MIAAPVGTSRLQGLLAGLRSGFLTQLSVSGHAAAYALAKQLEAELKREFIAGGHNTRTDEERQGHAPAINDTEVYTTAFGAVCSLGPVWRLLQEGTRPHIIRASAAPFLVFKGRDGSWVRTKEVHHPGTRADDMVGRSLAKLDLSAFSASVVTEAYARLLTRI